MPKPPKIKADTNRRPPAPGDSHGPIDEWIERGMPGLHPLVRRLDRLIRDVIPDLQYAVKWRKAYYGLPDRGWIIELVAYDVSANVVFLAGADFDSPPPLGTVGRSRYIKLRTIEEAETPEVRAWIEQAARVDGWT